MAESTRGQTSHALVPASAPSESQSAAAEAVTARFDPAVIGIGELDASSGKVYIHKGKTCRETPDHRDEADAAGAHRAGGHGEGQAAEVHPGPVGAGDGADGRLPGRQSRRSSGREVPEA